MIFFPAPLWLPELGVVEALDAVPDFENAGCHVVAFHSAKVVFGLNKRGGATKGGVPVAISPCQQCLSKQSLH
jgi:hypothetical protein